MQNIKCDIQGNVDVKGIKIHYEYFGKKDGPVVVLLNGIAMETQSWYQFLAPILEKIDVLLLDFRGQGKSTSDDAPYDIEDFACHVKHIIEKLELQPKYVNLVGVSFGASVVAEFLRKYGSMINKAIFSAVVLSPEKVHNYRIEFWKRILEKGLIDVWVDSLYSNLFSENFLKTIESFIPKLKVALNERYENRGSCLFRLLEAEQNYLNHVENIYPEYKKVENPILVIMGEYDIITPPYVQKKISRVFKNAKFFEHPESGHTVFMERPKEFFNQVIDFITR